MKRLLTVTTFTGMLTLLKMGAGFIIAKVVAIYVGPGGMATLGQLQNISSILNGLTNAPAGAGVVRYTAQYRGDGYSSCRPWWSASLRWILIITSIVSPFAAFFSFFISRLLFNTDDYYWFIIIIAFGLPISALGTFLNSVINGLQQYKLYIFVGMISVIVSSALMILLIIHFSLKGALIAASLQSTLIGIVIVLIASRQPWFKFSNLFGGNNHTHNKAIKGYIIMAIASSMCLPLSLIVVRKIIIAHVGLDAAGQWQAVWKISETYLTVITVALGTYFLPKLSTIKGYPLITREINKAAFFLIPVVISMGGGIYFFRDLIIQLLFTQAFLPARDLFFIQLCGDSLKILSWLYAYPMLSTGATRWYVGAEILSVIMFVFFSFIFIKLLGLQGVVVAYLINYAIYFIYARFVLKRII